MKTTIKIILFIVIFPFYLICNRINDKARLTIWLENVCVKLSADWLDVGYW